MTLFVVDVYCDVYLDFFFVVFFLMIRRPPRSTRTDTLFPYTTLFRSAPYGRLTATRPGEFVLLDTTPLNVFAVAPVTGKWVCADLTVAIDLYRSEEHTSELQSLMRISYAVFCLKKKKQ